MTRLTLIGEIEEDLNEGPVCVMMINIFVHIDALLVNCSFVDSQRIPIM